MEGAVRVHGQRWLAVNRPASGQPACALAFGLSRGGTMSGSTTDTKNAKHTDHGQRWAALDKRHERLFNPSDRALTENDSKDNNTELKAAS
jgi:hypothetical protein